MDKNSLLWPGFEPMDYGLFDACSFHCTTDPLFQIEFVQELILIVKNLWREMTNLAIKNLVKTSRHCKSRLFLLSFFQHLWYRITVIPPMSGAGYSPLFIGTPQGMGTFAAAHFISGITVMPPPGIEPGSSAHWAASHTTGLRWQEITYFYNRFKHFHVIWK